MQVSVLEPTERGVEGSKPAAPKTTLPPTPLPAPLSYSKRPLQPATSSRCWGALSSRSPHPEPLEESVYWPVLGQAPMAAGASLASPASAPLPDPHTWGGPASTSDATPTHPKSTPIELARSTRAPKVPPGWQKRASSDGPLSTIDDSAMDRHLGSSAPGWPVSMQPAVIPISDATCDTSSPQRPTVPVGQHADRVRVEPIAFAAHVADPQRTLVPV